jgi:hypothetical protein
VKGFLILNEMGVLLREADGYGFDKRFPWILG